MSKFHALAWLSFAATAFISAIFIPIHIISIEILPSSGYKSIGYEYFKNIFSNPLFKIYLFILISSGLYHGFYRFKTILEEKSPKNEKIIDYLTFTIAFILIFLTLFLIIII
jgi:succinate dehydrogenase hydrophobic anchor subunit